MTLTFWLVLFAVISFGLAVLLPLVGATTGNLNLLALGLMLWALAYLLDR